eukprot:s5737_g1.t1
MELAAYPRPSEPLRVKSQQIRRPGAWTDLGLPALGRSAGAVLLVLSAGRLSGWRHQRSKRTRGIVQVPACVAAEPQQEFAEVYGGERMNDTEILNNIQEQHGWTPQDKGAGGNCLFLSMAPQVEPEDLRDVHLRSERWEEALGSDLADRWKDLKILQRANILRQMAIMDEAEFLEELQALGSGELPPEADWRMRELFTDMLEEFVTSNKHGLGAGVMGWDLQGVYKRVRKLLSEYKTDQVHEFVLKHGAEYMQITGREGNWAGSSEMAALSSVLRRPVLAYGNNTAGTSKSVTACDHRSLVYGLKETPHKRPWLLMAVDAAGAASSASSLKAGARHLWSAALATIDYEEKDSTQCGGGIASCLSRCSWNLSLSILRGRAARRTGDVSVAQMQALSSAREWQAAVDLLQEVRFRRVRSSLILHNMLLTALGSDSGLATWSHAFRIFKILRMQSIRAGVVTYNTLANSLEKQGQASDCWMKALGVADMAKYRGVRRDAFSWSNIANSFRSKTGWNGAVNLLQEVKDVGMELHLFTSSAAIAAAESRWQEAFALSTWIASEDLQLDIVSHCSVISSCAGGQQWANALLMSQQHSSIVIRNAALSACERARRWERTCFMLEQAIAASIRPTSVSFNAALSSCEKVQHWDLSLGLLASMQKRSVKTSLVTLNAVLSNTERAQKWEQALQFLSMAWRLACPDQISFNAAISAQEKCGNWQWAFMTLDMMKSARCPADIISVSSAVSALDIASRWATALLLSTFNQQMVAPNVISCTAGMHACAASMGWQHVLSLMIFMQMTLVQQNCVTLHAALTAAENVEPQAGVLQLANDMAISAGGWDTAHASELSISKTVIDSWIEAPAAGLIARERELIGKSLLANLASLLFPCCASRTDPLAFVDALHCSPG